MNAYRPLLWTPGELFAAVDAAERRRAITPTQAAVLRRRLDGLTLADVAAGRGTSRQAVHDAQRKGLERLGLHADLIERLLDDERARRVEVLRRRFRHCMHVAMHQQRNDLGIECTGLDAAATRLLAGAC